MTSDQLRKALSDCQGNRDVHLCFAGVADAAAHLKINAALLVPDEDDHLVKLTDGRSEYVIDADRVAWVRLSAESNTLTTH
jgi:hypothetical protein|tara:strand:+ start:252 stop:494 length:243 start_codon:yes stop_codon:yes gene_type:complete